MQLARLTQALRLTLVPALLIAATMTTGCQSDDSVSPLTPAVDASSDHGGGGMEGGGHETGPTESGAGASDAGAGSTDATDDAPVG